MKRFNFEIEKVVKEIKKKKANVVLLQFPEGIKQDALGISKTIEAKAHVDCIVSGETCWGGCDIDSAEARQVGADLIVHFGHAPFFKVNFPVFYVDVEDKVKLLPLAKKSLSHLKDKKSIGLVSAIQHVGKLDELRNYFDKQGKDVYIPGAKGYAFTSGHVIGCEYSGLKSVKNKVDVVLVVGNQFHGLGAALALPDKEVLLLDAYNNKVEDMDELRRKSMKQRAASIARFKDAKKVGIIVGLKPGQRFGKPDGLKKALEKQGKEVIIITMREMTPDKIYNFYNVEGFIELACPRIAVDDYGKYKKPIITFKEAMVVIGKKKWSDLLEEGFV
ncbi:MAG: diphthamide biosynthesis enzyme Dph2 [Candidatus Woesearchaeota archaeon]|jgi:2-(3-amino-3-carboxypropyl)histidine synthase|nr:diphthamide biosynthesis enzyme Dph2 [Candidatus Woesearchaeota archaeon]MDP7324178.1 diphthamide biosynthesis enzyme Dph2 [Candidatus Woesearchaeota archaeon]MDP7457697.1 diphthamide biosynthesis enzyme Dph2 [Candidatus Woesearchaeota archaeon]